MHNSWDAIFPRFRNDLTKLSHGDRTFIANSDKFYFGIKFHKFMISLLNCSPKQFTETTKWLYREFGEQTLEPVLEGSNYGPDDIFSAKAKWLATNSQAIFIKDDETLLRIKLRLG